MVTVAFRAYFFTVGLFALWVGVWGYVVPTQVFRALPWTVPPLHARFIAAMYIAGLLAMTWSFFEKRIAAVRIPIALAAVWTGGLIVVSLLNIGDFDFAKPQVWFWMGAYAVFPLWGAWLYFRGGAAAAAAAESRSRIDPLLIVIAALCLLLAVALLFAPAAMSREWPWSVSPLLANIYAGPFLAWGVSGVLLAREARPEARRIVLASMLAFAVLALLASLLHLKLFHFDAPSAWIWFGALAASAAVTALRLAQARTS